MCDDQDKTKWMSPIVGWIEIPCWVGIAVLAIIAGTFDFKLAAIVGTVVLAAVAFIWWRVRCDVRSANDNRATSDQSTPKK